MRRSWGACVTATALLCAGHAGASSPGIVIDNTTALDGGTTSLSFNHTIGGGSNRYLLVAVGLNKFMSVAISSVKYNNVNMTQIGTETVGNGCGSTLWALGESSLPAAGTYSVAISAGGAGFNRMYATAISFTGVDQNNLPNSKSSNSSTTTNNPTVDVTTQRAQFVIDCACLRGSSMSTNSLAVGANQTQRSNASAQTVVVGVSTEPGADVAAPGTGTTTMSWTGTLSGTLNGWATSAVVLKPSNTTAIRLSDLGARPAGQGGAHLTWHTGLELDNLGFHVYRESSAGPVRITTSPIWGSAWLAGPGVAMTGGGSYSFVDPSPPGRHARYWLEEIELDGRRHRHGPIVVAGVPEPSLPEPAPPRVLLAAADPPAVEGPTPPWGDAPYLAPGEEHALQWGLAAGAAIKLTVDRDGWYEIPQPALLAAGLDPGADPRRLALFAAGRELPILVRGEGDGVLDPQDAVAFYGRGLNAPATDTQVYWLAAREGPGRRIERTSPAPGGSGAGWFPSPSSGARAPSTSRR